MFIQTTDVSTPDFAWIATMSPGRGGSPGDIDRDAQVAPSKANTDDSEDGDMDDNLLSFAELVARAQPARLPGPFRGDRPHWPAG